MRESHARLMHIGACAFDYRLEMLLKTILPARITESCVPRHSKLLKRTEHISHWGAIFEHRVPAATLLLFCAVHRAMIF